MNKTLSSVEEMDLRFIMRILIKRKTTIMMIALLFTVSIAIKVWMTAPVYSGNVYLEIGEVVNAYETVNNSGSTIIKLDNINNLKEITKINMAASNPLAVMHITTQNGTDNVLRISAESAKPEEIQSTLVNTVRYILTRHEEKVKLYQNPHSKIRMTKVVGKVSIEKDPKDEKKLFMIMVSLFGGLVLGIFLAFLQELIKKSN